MIYHQVMVIFILLNLINQEEATGQNLTFFDEFGYETTKPFLGGIIKVGKCSGPEYSTDESPEWKSFKSNNISENHDNHGALEIPISMQLQTLLFGNNPKLRCNNTTGNEAIELPNKYVSRVATQHETCELDGSSLQNLHSPQNLSYPCTKQTSMQAALELCVSRYNKGSYVDQTDNNMLAYAHYCCPKRESNFVLKYTELNDSKSIEKQIHNEELIMIDLDKIGDTLEILLQWPADESVECLHPVDCQVEWPDWSECSVSCGGGTKYRSANVTTPMQHGGKNCPSLNETKTCNSEKCMVCRTDIDLILVIDSSVSINYDYNYYNNDKDYNNSNFQTVLKFLSKIVKGLHCSSRVAALQYSKLLKVVPEFDFNTYKICNEYNDVSEAILKLEYHNGYGTYTGAALKFVYDNWGDHNKSGNRIDVDDVILVITDGAHDDDKDVKEYAARLRTRGDTIVAAVGVGAHAKHDDLMKITNNDSKLVHNVNNFSDLNEDLRTWIMNATKICEEMVHPIPKKNK